MTQKYIKSIFLLLGALGILFIASYVESHFLGFALLGGAIVLFIKALRVTHT